MIENATNFQFPTGQTITLLPPTSAFTVSRSRTISRSGSFMTRFLLSGPSFVNVCSMLLDRVLQIA